MIDIRDIRPGLRPDFATCAEEGRDLLRLFETDRHLPVQRRLICRWTIGADGKLACDWQVEISGTGEP